MVTHANAGEPVCLTIDLPGSKVYWVDQVSAQLRRANLDGTSSETFLSIGGIPTGLTIPVNPGTLLPLTLLSFDALMANEGVSLQWITTDEVNTEAFDVERSPDGRNFIRLASLPSKAGSDSHTYTYAFTDKSATTGKHFYRLKMRDIGGAFTYSKTIEVKYTTAARQQSFVLFPNPATNGNLYLRPLRRVEGAITVEVINAAGAVMSQSRTKMPNDNLVIPAGSLTNGTYTVRITGDKGGLLENLRFLKQ